MAGVQFISITDTYNVLNREDPFGRPRVGESNYLLFLDTRTLKEYRTSKLIYSEYIRRTSEDFLKPLNINIDCIENIIILDEDSTETEPKDDVMRLARNFSEWGSRYSVKIVDGGFRAFTRKYSFLATHDPNPTHKCIQENSQTMPLEITDSAYLGSVSHITKSNLYRLNIDRVIITDDFTPVDSKIEEKVIRVKAGEFTRGQARELKEKRVLIICSNGVQWSVVLGAAWLQLTSGMSRETSLQKIKCLQPNYILGKMHLDVIHRF